MKPSRRAAFQLAGGAVAGAFLTPAPWRLITDTALLSENWPGVPKPRRGEIRAKATNCALCPAGCAVKARCVGDQPVSLAGAAGGLCPFGLGAHHLPFHPARLRQGPVREAAAAVQARAKDGIAILDLNPGRTASWTYRRAMQSMNGVYIAETRDDAIDLHAAKTIVSLGVPLLDGWGTPSNVFAARENFRLIQIDAIQSRTAMLADEWIPVAPGNENAYAQTILSRAALPDVVLGDGPEVAEINRQLGAYGKVIVARAEAPVPAAWQKSAAKVTPLAELPDRSIHVLLIDEAAAVSYIPWHRIERKLAADPVVVTFAAFPGGYTRYAKYALPAAMYPEVLDDIAPAIDRVDAGFKLTIPLVAPRSGAANLAEFAGTLAGVDASNALRERAGEIVRAGQGQIAGAPVKGMSEDAFWKALNEGAEWKGGRSTAAPAIASRLQAPAPESPTDLPLVAIALPRTPAGSPLMTKLYQESNLRLAPNRIALCPADAKSAGVQDGARAILQTRLGKCAVEVTVDPVIPAGAVQVGGSPGIQDVCGHAARAKVVRA